MGNVIVVNPFEVPKGKEEQAQADGVRLVQAASGG